MAGMVLAEINRKGETMAATLLKMGMSVNFESGGVAAAGMIDGIQPASDRRSPSIFVRTNQAIPIVLGRGGPHEFFTTGNSCWIEIPGGEVVTDRDGIRVGVMMPEPK